MRVDQSVWWCLLALLLTARTSAAGELGTGGVCDEFQYYGSDQQSALLGSGDTGDRVLWVQAFEPLQYPWVYDEMCFSIYKAQIDVTTDLDIVVYDDLGPDGGPGNLLSLDTIPGAPVSSSVYTYTQYDFTPQVMTSGRRYFGVAWDSGTTPDVGMAANINSNGVPPGFYYSFDDGESWRTEGFASNVFALQLRLNGAPFCERVVYGELTAQSPTWNRISSASSSLACDALAIDVPQDGQYYKAFAITSDTGGPLVAIVDPVLGGDPINDAVMALYCDAFDPQNPTANLIAYDDNAGEGSYPAFIDNDALNLTPGQQYWLVISTNSADDTGDFQICLANGYRRIDPCPVSIEGTLPGDAPRFDRPADNFAYDSTDPCQAAVAPGSVLSVPYALYEVVADAAAPFTASATAVDGGVARPSLYLYCEFRASNPAANVIEGSTATNDGEAARLGDTAQIVLDVGVTYYLAVTTGNAGAGSTGAYKVCVPEGFTVTRAEPPSCDAGFVFGQPPYAPFEDWDHSGSGAAFIGVRYDNFFDVFEPITRVVWYATHNTLGGDACTRDPGNSRISFYPDVAGGPGTLLYEETVTTPPTDAGLVYRLDGTPLTLWRYEVVLSEPVSLELGWLSVGGFNQSGCPTYWMHSAEGNGTSAFRVSSVSFNDFDLAFCIYTSAAAHTADQNSNNQIDLSELLRVIQFYNSGGYGCESGTEDGFAPNDPDQGCAPHASDYNTQNWVITLSELLRLIQFYNSGGYQPCAEGEDGFCPGA